MGLEIKQSLRLSQRLVMTPQLQQAIKLLQLSRLELVEAINQELMENPLLDNSDEAETMASEFEEIQMGDQLKDDFDWENYLGEYSSAPAGEDNALYEDREMRSLESVLTRLPSLKDNLIWQLRMADLDEVQMCVGLLIIGNLNPDGYLIYDTANLAAQTETTVKVVEAVLKVVQQFDPLGVAARDLRECLLIQATELYPSHDLVHDLIESHLEDLGKRNYQAITRKLDVSLDEIAEALKVIQRLEPKPGRSASEEEPRYITPDIYVYEMDDQYVIVLNEDGLPKLRVNTFYKDSLAGGSSHEAKEYVQNKLRSAVWLIRSIHQRQRTIYKVTEAIVKFQREFFDKGIAHLKPLVLRDVAEEVGMHESTISRVTTNKYVYTLQGVFELKFFFNSGINRVVGGSVASKSVKERIRTIIAAEDSVKPLSDQVIGNMLQKENIDIARRTVAKYREMLGIISSSRRRQILKAPGRN
jgi:RNA polymerase sigma-54 factor